MMVGVRRGRGGYGRGEMHDGGYDSSGCEEHALLDHVGCNGELHVSMQVAKGRSGRKQGRSVESSM